LQKKFTKSPQKSPGKVFTKSPHKNSKSPHNVNNYKSPDLKRRRGWRNKPPIPYTMINDQQVAKRGGYEETQPHEPIEHIKDIDA
jgi:hypothetical protein